MIFFSLTCGWFYTLLASATLAYYSETLFLSVMDDEDAENKKEPTVDRGVSTCISAGGPSPIPAVTMHSKSRSAYF
jgi:hypothetical protein